MIMFSLIIIIIIIHLICNALFIQKNLRVPNTHIIFRSDVIFNVFDVMMFNPGGGTQCGSKEEIE